MFAERAVQARECFAGIAARFELVQLAVGLQRRAHVVQLALAQDRDLAPQPSRFGAMTLRGQHARLGFEQLRELRVTRLFAHQDVQRVERGLVPGAAPRGFG